MRAAGSSPVAMRTLAAIISLMAFPCMYWLSLELFRSRMAGWLAVALFSVSPVHVLYAREARHYSLWTLLIVLSSSALLWSLRRQTVFAWGIYALTVILGLYSHLFFVLVVVAHALYVLATTFTWPADRVSLPRPFRRYLYASFFSLLAFVPWLWIVLTSIPLILNLASWVEVSPPLSHLIRRWVVIYSVAFVDLEHLDSSGQFVPLLFVWLLIGYSLYFLFRHTTKKTWLFIYILTGTMAGALVLPDLILGGVRSTIPRYLIPSYIGLQLAVVRALSVKLSSTQSWQRAVWAVSVIGLLGIGSFSSTVAVQSEAWWDKGTDYGYPEMVRSINEASRPLLFVDSYNGGYFGDTLALGHALEPHVRLKWGIESIDNLDDIADQYSDVFWYKPTPALRKLAVRTGSYQLQPVVPDLLWRLTE